MAGGGRRNDAGSNPLSALSPRPTSPAPAPAPCHSAPASAVSNLSNNSEILVKLMTPCVRGTPHLLYSNQHAATKDDISDHSKSWRTRIARELGRYGI